MAGIVATLVYLFAFSMLSCQADSDWEMYTGQVQITGCSVNVNATALTVTGSCYFHYRFSLTADQQLAQTKCAWHRVNVDDKPWSESYPTVINRNEMSVGDHQYVHGTCSFTSLLPMHDLLGRNAFIVEINSLQHRLLKEILIMTPLAPVVTCPHDVTEGETVVCHCQPHPTAPGSPPATVMWRGLLPGEPLEVSDVQRNHSEVVHQCCLQWGDPARPLTLVVNHSFRVARRVSSLTYVAASLIVAAACVVFVRPELLAFLLRTLALGLPLLALPTVWTIVTWLVWGLLYGLWSCLTGLLGFVWACVSSVLYSVWYVIATFVGALTTLLVWGLYSVVVWILLIVIWRLFNQQKEPGSRPATSRLPVSASNEVSSTGPPSYWQSYTDYRERGTAIYEEPSVPKRHRLIQSDAESRAVAELMYRTWRSSCAGMGKDAKNLHHGNIQVLSVERIENLLVWDRYSHKRNKMAGRLRHAATPDHKTQCSTRPVVSLTSPRLGDALSRDMLCQINECYLFHGTKEKKLFEITRDGLDNRYAGNGLLGRGLYFAESSTKSDQYTDPKYARSDGDHVMLLVRVVLGKAFINTHQNPPPFVRPPCSQCQQISCQCPASAHYDSVVDDAGRLFREFVVYESSQCYPEYVIRYKRIRDEVPTNNNHNSNNSSCCVS